MENRTSKGKSSVYCSRPSQRIIPSSYSLWVSLMILLDFEIGFLDVNARYSSGNDSFCASLKIIRALSSISSGLSPPSLWTWDGHRQFCTKRSIPAWILVNLVQLENLVGSRRQSFSVSLVVIEERTIGTSFLVNRSLQFFISGGVAFHFMFWPQFFTFVEK